MTNTLDDEDGKRTLYVAIAIITLAIIALLIPSPPDKVPVIDVVEPNTSVIHRAYADETHVPDIKEVGLHQELETVCSCESKGVPDGKPEHYESDGITVLSGRVDPRDRGMCQISSYYWGETAQELGYDIETPSGNIQMANYIFETQGLQPWEASRKCWKY